MAHSLDFFFSKAGPNVQNFCHYYIHFFIIHQLFCFILYRFQHFTVFFFPDNQVQRNTQQSSGRALQILSKVREPLFTIKPCTAHGGWGEIMIPVGKREQKYGYQK